MRLSLQLIVIGLCLGASESSVWSQEQSVSRDDRITPERLGLPKANTRTSDPFVTRIYKTDDFDQVLKPQPPGYPFTIHEDYTLKENEKPQPHEGVDLSSRPAPGLPPKSLEFKAGVYGLVVKAGDGPWGMISVQLRDGSVIQYLHTSASHVKIGDIVAPDTPLGLTGKTGQGAFICMFSLGTNTTMPCLLTWLFGSGRRSLRHRSSPMKTLEPNSTQNSSSVSSRRS
jgi:murein DD-endopeptidase MepM/ murein hydrolase activator NlpD